jgi:hypothetical protein
VHAGQHIVLNVVNQILNLSAGGKLFLNNRICISHASTDDCADS